MKPRIAEVNEMEIILRRFCYMNFIPHDIDLALKLCWEDNGMKTSDIIALFALIVAGLSALITIFLFVLTQREKHRTEAPRIILDRIDVFDFEENACTLKENEMPVLDKKSYSLSNSTVTLKSRSMNVFSLFLNFSETENFDMTDAMLKCALSSHKYKNIGGDMRQVSIKEIKIDDVCFKPDRNCIDYFGLMEKSNSVEIFIFYLFPKDTLGDVLQVKDENQLETELKDRANNFKNDGILNKKIYIPEKYSSLVIFLESVSVFGKKYKQRVFIEIKKEKNNAGNDTNFGRHTTWIEEGWENKRKRK